MVGIEKISKGGITRMAEIGSSGLENNICQGRTFNVMDR
jgi:hypothetical protein